MQFHCRNSNIYMGLPSTMLCTGMAKWNGFPGAGWDSTMNSSIGNASGNKVLNKYVFDFGVYFIQYGFQILYPW